MELEDLKPRHHTITAPQSSTTNVADSSPGALTALIEQLKREDAQQLKALKHARPLWWIAAILFGVVFVVMLLETLAGSHTLDAGILLRGLLALLFGGLAIALFRQMKVIATIDYTEPTRQFLEKAAKRYQFMSKRMTLLSLVLTMILAGAASLYIIDVFARYLNIHNPFIGIAATYAFLTLVYLFGYTVTKIEWKRSRKPLLEQIVKLQRDLETEPEVLTGEK